MLGLMITIPKRRVNNWILSGHEPRRPAETRRATAHRLPRAGDRAACILPRTANPAEGGAAGQDAGARGLSTRPGPGGARRTPLLAQMQAGGRLTP
ncbi:Dynein heavy chain [Giardia duodenalis]|uniref:Dynein heavy chain n=1 Tax=Giardia intestinalis TaxID=5741 RepID=V6TYH5_GIAIN|nr:Dynein heavy chain [Giardia intestinalis]